MRTTRAAMKTASGLRDEILKRNMDPGARGIQRVVQLVLDHVHIEKLLAGDADFEVPQSEVDDLLSLAIKELMPGMRDDESGSSD
jgi:hypothetical protein